MEIPVPPDFTYNFSARTLVVLLHAFGSSPNALSGVRSEVQGSMPSAAAQRWAAAHRE